MWREIFRYKFYRLDREVKFVFINKVNIMIDK